MIELKKQISCSLQLSNKTDSYVAFKVKTTNPKKYCVRPNAGIVLPRSTCDVIVTMQAQKDAPTDMQCKDKFLLQSVKTVDGAAAKDINAEMFNKEAGHIVEECKLRVVYVSPPQPPSPVAEGSEEGSSPRGSVSDNGNINSSEFSNATKAFADRLESQDKSPEARAIIAKLNEEKNSAIQQSNKLRQELELLKRGGKNRGGVSFIMATAMALRRAAAHSALFSKLTNPVRALAPSSASRLFTTQTQVASSGGDDHDSVEIDHRRGSSDRGVFDPFAPASSLSQVLNLMDQFMDNPFSATARRGGAAGSRRGIDVKEDENGVYVRMDMPGLGREDVKITVEQNTLVIRGEGPKEESGEEEGGGRRYSSRLDLPPNVFKLDEIKAEMKNGVLKLVVPKVEEKKDVIELHILVMFSRVMALSKPTTTLLSRLLRSTQPLYSSSRCARSFRATAVSASSSKDPADAGDSPDATTLKHLISPSPQLKTMKR
ncbi:hypothetical protein Tsubulata_026978 [Turnera subulata]|uniref:MSP domain-containing protein n=1 Tax=Turnera subulata TaxID=218843 RepID=A0A9Q0FKK0_9ROSI|nr:hypothetical protein Tsubulata_026978 [Turnera subulata]